MKFRFLKVGGIIWGKHNLTKNDLLDVKRGAIDFLIDLQNGTYFDADTNTWKELEGDED